MLGFSEIGSYRNFRRTEKIIISRLTLSRDFVFDVFIWNLLVISGKYLNLRRQQRNHENFCYLHGGRWTNVHSNEDSFLLRFTTVCFCWNWLSLAYVRSNTSNGVDEEPSEDPSLTPSCLIFLLLFSYAYLYIFWQYRETRCLSCFGMLTTCVLYKLMTFSFRSSARLTSKLFLPKHGFFVKITSNLSSLCLLIFFWTCNNYRIVQSRCSSIGPFNADIDWKISGKSLLHCLISLFD